jgi:hypothetical protein
MRALAAAVAAVVIFALSALLLMLAGAFTLRLLLGAATYRSSGAWVAVIIVALAVAATVSLTAFRGFRRRIR